MKCRVNPSSIKIPVALLTTGIFINKNFLLFNNFFSFFFRIGLYKKTGSFSPCLLFLVLKIYTDNIHKIKTAEFNLDSFLGTITSYTFFSVIRVTI